MFDMAGAVGSGHLRSRRARLQAVARHRNLQGDPLPARIAAVELLNLLRPAQAVSVFIAHALHEYPACREALRQGDPQFTERFIQEVRRWYPFFPAVAARLRQSSDWDGHFSQRECGFCSICTEPTTPRAYGTPRAVPP